MNAKLLILAAGMGSRYGGLKQLEKVGPGGETLLDYSIYDALRAGFSGVVFVIRRDFEREFREKIGRFYEERTAVDYVFQELDHLPSGHSVPSGRTKPWGTGHAIWCARDVLQQPFAAINADDFYGASGFRALADFFRRDAAGSAMVGYRLDRTLSEHGSVSRGVCSVSPSGTLVSVEEFTQLERTPTGIQCVQPDGHATAFDGRETVSMNFWGFRPSIFPQLEGCLREFLQARGTGEKSEFYIPFAVGDLINRGELGLSVLSTDSEWFGVTYREDKDAVTSSIRRLVSAGEYPPNLWAPQEATV